MTRRPLVAALLAAVAVTSAFIFVTSRPATDGREPGPNGASLGGNDTAAATPIPIPVPGHEVYGYVPYWEMDDGIAEHLAGTDLTTLALFSVTHKKDGSLAMGERGIKRIVSAVGRRLIADAHDRGVRVELVYTSFGRGKNDLFFTTPDAQARTIAELVELAGELGVDGINVDVELLAPEHVVAYGDFVGRLRSALRAVDEDGQVSVATQANVRGTAMALAASIADADRVFLMGYDYHWSGSQPGASSPVDRIDGLYDLRWSIDSYVEAGVPRDRILLGLPLYGMTWRSTGPDRFSPVVGNGKSWILDGNLDVLLDPEFTPQRDPIEHAEFFVKQDGDTWLHTYYDSPATLRLKLALARDHGLAGGGFWAIGYEQGLPGYLELMADFRDGKVERSEAPAAP
jgi:spore germination protein